MKYVRSKKKKPRGRANVCLLPRGAGCVFLVMAGDGLGQSPLFRQNSGGTRYLCLDGCTICPTFAKYFVIVNLFYTTKPPKIYLLEGLSSINQMTRIVVCFITRLIVLLLVLLLLHLLYKLQ